MKKIIVFLLIAASLISCNKVGENEFLLNGTIAGVPDGKIVTLQRLDDSLGPVRIDTTKVKGGKFSFKGKILEPGMHSLKIESVTADSYLVIENDEINIEIIKDSVFKNKMSGSYNNDQLYEFNQKSIENEQKKKQFNKKYQAKFQLAQSKNDTAYMNKVRTEYEAMEKKFRNSVEDYIKTHPKAIISGLLTRNLLGEFEPDIKKIETFYNGLDKSIQDSQVGKSILKKIKEFKHVGLGKKAPDFSAPDTQGKVVSLNQNLGKITIIDFWASWCGPCRKENPNMVKLYAEFHDKGLNIIGVSLDKDATKWKQAIATDKLTWTQVSNLKEWNDPIALQYGVKQIPTTFLLNQFGIIVAKDLSAEALKAKVNELLAAK